MDEDDKASLAEAIVELLKENDELQSVILNLVYASPHIMKRY